FASFLNNKKMPLSLVISLEVGESKLVERLLKRGIDSGRADDSNEDTIRARIQVYHQQTSILKKFYSDNLKKHFFEINGEREIEVISQDILSILKKY
ncbi:MAG: adenylate kinase, partial [Flavobacteriales bacterium]|nr:adenylate kinase [Flavobacteriales bacterium]